MASGEAGSQSTPQPVPVTMGAMPGRSEATTGTPAAIASHSFWGVVYWWFSLLSGRP